MTNTPGITRRKLYEMVWEEPVEDVAIRFGLSGRGLAKLCERQSIPVPPRGYWQKRTAGRAGVKPPLLIAMGDEAIPRLLHRAVKPDSAGEVDETASSNLPADPFFVLYAAQVAACERIGPKKRAAALHPVIAAWQQRERRDNEADWEMRRRFARSAKRAVTSDLQKRMWFLQDALFRHLTGQGFTVSSDQHRMNAARASIRTTGVECEVSERIRQYRRPLTPEESASDIYRGQKHRQIREPTGELIFDIKSPMPTTVPDRWQDGPDKPLENQLAEIAAGFAVAVAYRQKLNADEHAAYERQREAEEARARRLRERELEKERRQGLRQRAVAWEEAQRLRAFVAAVEAADANGCAPALHLPLAEWREWARMVADEIDPLTPTP